jgi:Acyl-CoA synthetases (AMP-forming)/AMP-acid ligases II
MPLYHSAAACLGLCSVLFVGATCAIGRRFSTKTFWKEVRETKSTIIQYVGETCRYLTVAPPERDPVTGENLDRKHYVRAAMGNGLRPDVWDKFKERFGIDVSPLKQSFQLIDTLAEEAELTSGRLSSSSTPPLKPPSAFGTNAATTSARQLSVD